MNMSNYDLDFKPSASGWNISNGAVNIANIKMDSNFAMLLCSLVFAVSWVIYITYYNSRLVGYIITKIVNRFLLSEGHFKLGSFTLNALSGKIMFRDLVYITNDFTVRVQDGYLIFRWWRSYVPKDVSEDLSHSDTRLSMVLNGFELHVYNRSHLYSHLQKVFGLEQTVFLNEDDLYIDTENQERNDSVGDSTRKQRPEAAMARTWRDLIPVIKVDISSSRLVFGNRLVPTTLSITVEESHFVYSTKPAVSTLDRFMHFTKCKAENARVMLAPSPKYTGMLDEPPRYMGEGFVLMSTNDVELYFYMDEPGLVPEEPVLITLANGDVVESSPPQWGVDIKCGKGTDFSYGPWADRQREHLFKFFYPQEYLPMVVTKTPRPGDKRQMQSFDVRLLMQNEATIDILFSKNKETNAVHINVGAGSYLEITLPWITLQDGYTTRINGQLLHLDATTSLQFRDLVVSETLEFTLLCHYPPIWNDHQLWEFNFTGCKATINVIFNHKWFFQDLINDWSSKQRPDLLHFVPYTWRFGLTLKHCELITLVNQYNWIDCSSVGQRQRLENTQIALCAHFLHLSFDLPFDEFLPETVPLNFSIQGESIDLCLFIPEFHTSRNIVLALEKHAKVRSKDGSTTKKTEIIPKWRNYCQNSSGWVDFWWVPIGAINILYVYHPCPPLGPTPQADISTPVKEELLLSPMRLPHHRKSHRRSPDGVNHRFDPTTLSSDIVTVELEIGPSVLLLYGTALRNFLNLKENIFGDDQMFTDMQQSSHIQDGGTSGDLKSDESMSSLPLELQDNFDQRNYRPLEVDVSVIMHDIQAHLLKNCTEKDPPCPVILVERFGFEMKKRYDQTELQLLLSPAIMLVSDNVNRPSKDKHLNQGRLTLSSLQVRGHAMFSDVGRSLDQDTIEYAWLLEIQLGKLSGKLTSPQLYSVIASLETLLLLLQDTENELISPKDDVAISQPAKVENTSNPLQNLPQNVQQALQQFLQSKNSSSNAANKGNVSGPKGNQSAKVTKDDKSKMNEANVGKDKGNKPGTTGKDSEIDLNDLDAHKLKYKFCRVAIDAVDFWLVETGAALQLWVSPIRLATCNLHGKQVGSGLSCVIYSLSLRQTVWQPHKYNHTKTSNSENSDFWLEVGAVNFGPLIIESATSSEEKAHNSHSLQQRFLKTHDERLKKLWFLWPDHKKCIGKCGCTGGCMFFGSNKNGIKFFRPSRNDLDEGTNVAAFRVNEPGKDAGFGQSILHDGMLLFRTPPYIPQEITLQDTYGSLRKKPIISESPKVCVLEKEKLETQMESLPYASPVSLERKVGRRYSSTSIKSSIVKDVPYSRLIDNCPSVLPIKLDSDSKLHTEKGKLIVNIPDSELLPKNSASDSKLAVDYFNSPVTFTYDHQNNSGPSSDITSVSVSPQMPVKTVNVSESHHSLGTRRMSEEQMQKEVQRTISMSSENHSEAFFSADEDVNISSRSSSLRNSMLCSNVTLTRQESVPPQSHKKFSSELSIVADRAALIHGQYKIGSANGAPGSAPESARLRLTSHRSDHEIHTPEHRSFSGTRQLDESHRTVQGLVTPHRHPNGNRSTSPRFPSRMVSSNASQSTVDPVINDSLLDSSDSYSSTSYASAVGSQEDFTLVDLHMQVNRQIVDSPMLMSSYVSHLNQVRCSNWVIANQHGECDSLSMPLFQKNIEDKLVYVGGRFVPFMEPISEGVTSLKMVTRSDQNGINGTKTPTTPYVYTWDQEESSNDDKEGTLSQEEELLGMQSDVGSRTSIIIKLKGDIDITVTPLLLETFQRYIDALTPTLAHLHPLTVINHLHTSCVSQVEGANILKTTENIALLNKNIKEEGSGSPETCTFEETIKDQLQAAIVLPKVNITLLQVSIVEEIISFSALDNIKDLTCVSMFSVSFDNITAKFHSDKQMREVLQKFNRPVVQQGSKKGANKARHFLGLHTNTNSDTIKGEPVYIETCERQQSQLVVCLNIGKVHAQLRRLRNESSILEDAVITAIPSYCSKVLFTCAKIEQNYRGVDYYLQPPLVENLDSPVDEFNNEDKLGFIMFECGLEGVSIKIVKKSQFDNQSEEEADEKQAHTDSETIHDSSNDQADTSDTSKGTGLTPKMGENRTSTAKKPSNLAKISVQVQKAEKIILNQKVEKTPQGQKSEKSTPSTQRSEKMEEKPAEGGKTKDSVEGLLNVSNSSKDGGNVSSCVIELKVVWFNFAAPPRTPITRKIDYTRLDWNLLSTASPAINAWMNPSNRLAIRVVHMVRSMYRRSTATIACLMAEALDVQGLHLPSKSRYGKMTPLAKTLQEDPSCQLCSVLQKYILQTDYSNIESNLRESEIPQLFTLRQGVIVLSRQWKNILYTPLFPQQMTKSRVKPLNVTIAIPDMNETRLQDICLTDGEASGNEETDITDEHARLLHSGIILKPSTHKTIGIHSKDPGMPHRLSSGYGDNMLSPQTVIGAESTITSPSPPVQYNKHKKALPVCQLPSSSRASVVLPLLTSAIPFTQKKIHEDNIGYDTLKEDRTALNLGSDPSVCTHSSPDLQSSPLHGRGTNNRSSEDLYSWMVKQDTDNINNLQGYMECKIDTLQTESTMEGTMTKENVAAPGISLYPIHDSVRLMDSNLIFQPLLSSLGVMPHQLRLANLSDTGTDDVTSLDALGSNLSLVGNMDTMRIDIVVSEHGKTEKKKGKSKSKARLFLEINTEESPAFVCEKVSVELEVERMTDMAVNDMIKTRNFLYISRGQLKNHTSTVLNFNIGVRYISQRVNMPLLRLLHQISNMYQNVKDTQNELREQQPVEIRRPKTSASDHADIKHHHSTSTSDLQDSNVADYTKQLSLKISDPGSITSQQKPIISPSPSIRSRPQSFAQKLRSKTAKGYVNLSEGAGTPVTLSSPSGSALEHITVSSDKSTGRCWKTIYHLLDLYANMPDTKTIKHRFSVGTGDISEHYKGNRKYDILTEVKSTEDLENKHEFLQPPQSRDYNIVSSSTEHTKLVVFGVARIHRTRLLATLSGLKLEAEITSLHSSLTCRKKSVPATLECSVTGQVGRTMIVLLEGVAPNQQTVVKVTVGKSQALYSSISKRSKDKNSGLLTVGAVNIDIPQHPVALHGMVTRGSKQLSSTLQELRVTRTSSRLSRGPQNEDEAGHPYSPNHQPKNVPLMSSTFIRQNLQEKSLLQPLVMQFSVILQSLSITAALLPSLQAQYKMDQVSSTGVTGSKAKFTITLPHHSLSFTTKLQVSEANLPSEASIALPAVHVSAEYIPENATGTLRNDGSKVTEGVVFMQGGYLSAHADIGVFEHSLTTDLLNHLVFVQKVFMKEVNEVVQKVYGGERPVPIWLEDSEEPSNLNRILFSLVIQIQRIQLTATTAGSSAVRLETGAVILELSNRVQNVSGSTQSNTTSRLFGKAQVNLNLSLGQLIRNAMFEEAEVELQQFAFFNTRIELRNAFQDEIVEGEDKEVVLITLKRPLIYIQPVAVDKAILVWLNYKNAYDYWNDKRANLNKEVLTATQQVYEKFQFGQLTSQLSAPHLGTLFLQLTVEDMGICLPLNPLPLNSWAQRNVYEESRGAVVVTLENTSISACSSGSLVSKGKFSNLCLRFAVDFETSLDDWKPDMSDSTIMNLCVVSDGTYEVCSRTIAAKQPNENAKWILNVQWQMEGVDIHLDTNVGKQLSALGHTLTMLTGAEDNQFPVDYDSDDNEPMDGTRVSQESILPAFVFDPSLDNKKRSKLIEKEMNEQAKIINDLRSLGASYGTIELELKRLHELEAMVYKDFRRDMIQKLRRQSVKASSIKGKLGLGPKATTYRSRSFIIPSPMPENQGSPDDTQCGNASVNSASFESSPRSGPSRSASLRVRHTDGPRVTFSDAQAIGRQSSLPSASSDLSLPETHLDWGDHINIDGEKVELRKKMPSSYDSHDGGTLLESFAREAPFSSSPFQTTNTNMSQSIQQKPQEPNIDLELDVKVFINSGKCVLHTKDSMREEEIKLRMKKDRSSSAGLLEFPPPTGSPDPTRRNKDKHARDAGSSRLRNTPHATSLVDLTIFHIPGMDVKLQYQSKVVNEDLLESEQDSPMTYEESRNFSNLLKDQSFGDSFTSKPFEKLDESRIEKAFKRQDSRGDNQNAASAMGDFTTDFTTELKSSTSMHGITNPNYGNSPTSSRTSLDNFPFQMSLTPPNGSQTRYSGNSNLGGYRNKGIKKASLFAWMTLQSVPEETIISPHILEFLEQTLEPIPAKTMFNTTETSILSSDQDINYGNYVYASFPVDVIVYFHMQPSTFRFSCLPVSRVECMLQLPSLDIVFSSKRAADELLYSEFGDDTPNTAATAVGGLSVTGCLSDFSVYIFHPYGGKKSTLKEAQWSPLSDSERKDSLSINVEFVKFHLSRSRMLNFNQEGSLKGKYGSDGSRAVIRFSTITDIGSASFKYDMRRLTEILAFPKAWYRRSIVRRMFLGDLSLSGNNNDDDESVLTSSSPGTTRTYDSRSSRNTNEKSPLMNREKLKLSLDNDFRHSKLKDMGKAFSTESAQSKTPTPDHKNTTAWETLVLFAVNFKKLNVHMNMGNVMGNVSWLTKDFRSDGRLSIGSTGHKNLYIAVGLGGSGLDAKGGIVGGNIEIAKIDTYIHIREEPDIEPDHTVGLRLHALELRLDYMATSVLMCRVSDLNVNLNDEWKLNRSENHEGSMLPTRRPATIFMHGVLSWDQLQIMMSKSSTADLLKMFNKLEEFFSQQFNSSKRAFSGFSQAGRAPRITPQKSWSSQQQTSTINDAKHHRHWQKVLAQVAGLQLTTMHVPLPPYGTVLGGTMELHGNNISLACFHGINFKSKSWALFSLKEPSITFNTEAQEIPSTSEAPPAQDVHVVQTLTCSLGLSTYKTHHSMATVCKVSRSVIFPPQFKTLQEWFHYAFANSQIDEVDKFPSLERERDGSNSIERGRGSTTTTPKLTDPNHTREVIFALPSLQLHLKTEHLQTSTTPEPIGEKPMVECSFITEFEDHIFVTVDAEAFFFLHDLITSYVKEKEKVLGNQSRLMGDNLDKTKLAQSSSTPPSSAKKSIETDIFAKDFRNYNCKTWHLEPTVRLLSVAGKYIEPYGVDYILQKLGFSHARTTIPKWMQRGFMDPLDAILAVLTVKMVQVIKGDGNKNDKETRAIKNEKEKAEAKK